MAEKMLHRIGDLTSSYLVTSFLFGIPFSIHLKVKKKKKKIALARAVCNRINQKEEKYQIAYLWSELKDLTATSIKKS